MGRATGHMKLESEICIENEYHACYVLQEKGDFLQFGAESPGIYVAVSVPKVERVEVPVQGCLYSAKINRQISLRFPKKTTDMDMTCDIRVSTT